MGNANPKQTHSCGKVPLSESAKCSIGGKGQKKQRKTPCCSICGIAGHNASKCKMPPYKKRRVDLPEFDVGALNKVKEYNIKTTKRRKALDLVSVEDWI